MNSTLRSLILTFFIGFLVACSLEPISDSARIFIRIEEDGGDGKRVVSVMVSGSPSPAPATVSGFQCLGVNVTGPGIPDTSEHPEPNLGMLFDRLLRRESYCSYRGLLTGPLSTSASQPQEVSLLVPPGASRLIQLVGIQEIGGSNSCQAEFNPAIPRAIGPSGRPLEGEVYELGRVVADLFGDRAITMTTDWNSLSSAQRAERKMDCGGGGPNPGPSPSSGAALLPTTLAGVGSLSDVAVAYHTCVVSAGSVLCKGFNGYGQLGDGTIVDTTAFVSTSGASGAAEIGVGNGHSCYRGSTVKCWGMNTSGQLGNGTTAGSNAPVVVSGIGAPVQIAVGAYHACALAASPGAVKCWGANNQGQLGDGSVVDRTTPVSVTGITNAISISAGENHTCAILNDGTARCWGGNDFGQLGDGTTTNSPSPITVSGFAGGSQISAGANHTCAKYTSGSTKVACWGMNNSGQIGNGTTTSSSSPIEVTGVSPVLEVRAGAYHTCALVSATDVKCWGSGSAGQLGTGGNADSTTPVNVAGGLSGVTAIRASSSGHTTCAISGSSAKCWGSNSYGQIHP